VRLVDLALVAAAPEPEATTSIASGLADTSFSACGVTLVSLRAKRSAATTLMPAASPCLVNSFSHSSP
jgi:hypothetical protein